MNRTERLYAIAEELRAAGRSGRTSAWLARRLEVSTRTVKRDIDALLQAGLPLWAQAGPGGGYVLDSAGMPPLSITAAEAAAIAVALAALPDLPFAVDGRSALSKVLAAMPAAERERAESIATRLWLRTPEEVPRPAVARVIDEALRRQRVLVIGFRDRDGGQTERAVEPVALAATGGHWHLLAWCRLREGPRWFRTDRITAAHLTNEPAPEHDPATLFGTPPPDAHPVRLR
ncbi:helix-turn-helix transcriptional regulator [Pseudonocardia humida]|uniref:WYL domain-containing protein n=1 Tax=Pseudonocardia humida TaxID=2800819 RepID=A0ABT0ZWS4_9PSEU|nr:WYL domain-containing protein [Pseudonocardia humida]MCO1655197.1 WYL domain-containing protein [Pseudonocardia humida]